MPDASGRFRGISVPAETWERVFGPPHNGTDTCLCGGRGDRFPQSAYACRCYGKRNRACTCIVNPGGYDGVMHMHDCPVHP